jgi:hypothetical protein
MIATYAHQAADQQGNGWLEMTDDNSESYGRFYVLRPILTNCILPTGYSFPTDFGNSLSLTELGNEWLNRLRDKFPDLSDSDGKAALFGEFAIEDQFLIDFESSDFERFYAALDHECRGGTPIRFPYVYGRELDDAYINIFGHEPRQRLTHEETIQLLDISPAGVFQKGTTTIGPLGLVESKERRNLVPTQYGPIVLCKDPGCPGRHQVMLTTGETVVGKAYMEIDPERPLSPEFRRMLGRTAILSHEYDPDFAGTLPWLLTNGFSSRERDQLLCALLDTNIDGVRELVNQRLSGSVSRLTSTQIIGRLTESERLQLLLTISDKALVEQLEILMAKGEIIVGATEVRTPFMARHEDDGPLHIIAEAGNLGVRFVRRNTTLAPLRLRVFLRALFDDSVEELDWILRNESGSSAFERLDYYLRSARLNDVVNRLVMSSRSRLLKAIEISPYGFMGLPTNEQDEKKLVRTILWKLGDSLPAPPAVESHLQALIEILEKSIDRGVQIDRLALEGLRSAGVNLFVELESVLTQVVEYACWLLLNDHYNSDRTHRFRYSEVRARQFTHNILSTEKARLTGFIWDGDGKNSLGTLIEAMRVLAKQCDQILGEREKYARAPEEFPFFASAEHMFDFPFVHTALILDLDSGCAERIIATLRTAASELERGSVAEQRNKFSHARDDIPSPAEIGEACDAIRKAIDLLVREGLVPTVYVLSSNSTDAFGRSLIELADGSGRSVSFYEPSELHLCGLPKRSEPQVIARGAIIAGGIQFVRLSIEEDTEFTRLWAAYQQGSGRSAILKDNAEGNNDIHSDVRIEEK